MISKAQKLTDSMTNDYAEDELENLVKRVHRTADEVDKMVPKKKGGALDFNNIKHDKMPHAPKIPKRSFPKM